MIFFLNFYIKKQKKIQARFARRKKRYFYVFRHKKRKIFGSILWGKWRTTGDTAHGVPRGTTEDHDLLWGDTAYYGGPREILLIFALKGTCLNMINF